MNEFLQSDITSSKRIRSRKYADENNGSSSSGQTTESTSQTSRQGSSRLPRYPSRREEKKELIEQFEPGVYVTLIQLSNGTKIFKRVRFRYLVFFICFCIITAAYFQ